MAKPYIGCSVKELPQTMQVEAARIACEINPNNTPNIPAAAQALFGLLTPGHLAVLTSKYFGPDGRKLSVQFLDNPDVTTQNLILSHMNAWNAAGVNIVFERTNQQGEVRINRQRGDGYWSYLGTDVLSIPRNQPTMNLDSFTSKTPVSEYKRVVRHETGHTMGFPHEHMRKELVALLDEQKTITYFQRTQGWDANTTRQQVLTPLDARSIRGTPQAEDDSIMCYGLPASITKNNVAIPGGSDLTPLDISFARSLYPMAVDPQEPPPPVDPTDPDEPTDPTAPAGEYALVLFKGRVALAKFPGVTLTNAGAALEDEEVSAQVPYMSPPHSH